MSKISCNVTKDLLPVYLDDICSEESKSLVEEHLQECAKCKQFLEQMNVKDIIFNETQEPAHFFKKAKQYLDNRYRIVFFIALLFVILMVIYSEIYYRYIPDVIVYVSLPVLMCTFFLANPAQPIQQNKEEKYRFLPFISISLGAFLIGFHFFFVEQLTILFTSPNKDKVCTIFQAEPAQLGPFVEKIYLICIFAEILLIAVYFMLAKKKRHCFPLGQNASWLGMGLGVMFRESLYRMDTLEGFKQASLDMTCTLVAEFIIIYVLNHIYIKKICKTW